MHDPQYWSGVSEAAHVAAPDIAIRDVVATLRDTLTNSLNAPLGIVHTDIEKSGEK